MIRQRLPHLAILLIVGSLYLAGGLAPLERTVTDLRFRLLQRAATGDLVFVQIDARSLHELGVWPWPRELHAELLDHLFAAGVREVALDVDLSSVSNEASDARFAEALERHGRQVILPAFRQLASPGTGSTQTIDNLPLDALRANAQVGTVNVATDFDGVLRRVDSEQWLEGRLVPSMFVLLAGPAYLDSGRFRIDFGIDPASIPRLSYVDVLRGDLPASSLQGKQVIVGASAAELGDSLAVPQHQVLPGALVQVLAYESLVQGRALHDSGLRIVLPVALLISLLLLPHLHRLSWRKAACLAGASIFVIEGLGILVQAVTPVALATPVWSCIVALGFGHSVTGVLRLQDLQLLRQRLAMARRRVMMDSVVRNSFDGIVITESKGRIELFNDAAATILGRRGEDMLGRLLPDVLPVAVDAMWMVDTAPSVVEDETAVSHFGPDEYEITRADGETIVIELVASRFEMKHGRLAQRFALPNAFYSFAFRNITERRRLREAELAAVEMAEAASRSKSEFLANMSHELRTPLNSIIGFTDIIKSEAFGPVEEPRYRGYVDDINKSGHHLLAIINDILDVSRVELGQLMLNCEAVNLSSVVDSCCVILAGWPASRERELDLEIAPDLPDVEADARLLKQILINLLSNAVKYSHEGTRITLRVYLDAEGAPTLKVEDQGIGIAAEAIPKLTTPFFQVDGSLSRKQEGTGLGLCLVAAYTELHGGTLTIDSAPDVGTKVTVRLPAASVVRNEEPRQDLSADLRAVG